MSHFLLAAILDSPEDLEDYMDFYYEGLEVAPYLYKTKEEALNDMREHDFIKSLDISDDEYRKKVSQWYFGADEAPYSLLDEMGDVYSSVNPQGKWDWYVVGGRWDKYLRLKDGFVDNVAKVKDLDFSLNQEDYEKGLRFWEVIVEGSSLKDGESKIDFFCFEDPQFFLDAYGDKENFAKAKASYCFHALLVDGRWYEKGQMGWFGMSDSTPESIRSFNAFTKMVLNDPRMQEKYIVVVDCHI